MNRYFGYARISTPQQSIERQIRNILAAYPQSEIIREVFTGTKFQGRREFEKLLKKLNAGDTIIFDSVSRMSRDAEEGFTMYEEGINKYLLLLAKEQIRLAFEQSEKEVQDLRQRTKEGMQTARLSGKQIGQASGSKLVTKKSIAAKEIILKHNKTFGGSLNDLETITQAGITRKTFYKYKKELLSEMIEQTNQR